MKTCVEVNPSIDYPEDMKEYCYEPDPKMMAKLLTIEEMCEGKFLKKNMTALRKLVKEDPTLIEAYWVMWVYSHKAFYFDGYSPHKYLFEGYDQILKIVLDKNGRWPDRIPWGWMENRPILRMLQGVAEFYWDCGADYLAREQYVQLLKLNPNDNQGIRYELIHLLKGYSFKIWKSKIDKAYDETNIHKYFEKHYQEFWEVFRPWFEIINEVDD